MEIINEKPNKIRMTVEFDRDEAELFYTMCAMMAPGCLLGVIDQFYMALHAHGLQKRNIEFVTGDGESVDYIRPEEVKE